MNKTKTMLYPFLITWIGAILMMAMLLLPFASANKEYQSYLLDNKDELYAEELGMSNAEAVNISLAEYAKMYIEAVKQGFHMEAGIVCIVIIIVFAILTVFTVLLSLLKKPIGILVFDILALASFWAIRFDFEDRGVVPSDFYDWGIASWLTYVIGVVVATGAIWMFFEKRKAEK